MSSKNFSTLKRLRKHAQKRLVFEPGIPKNQQLSAYKRYLELENKMLKRNHRNGSSGKEICQMRTTMIDVIIENLFLSALDLYLSKYKSLKFRISLIALGGYGRGELNPHSDIDIMFLYPTDSETLRLDQFKELMAEEILYPLWDLGLKVGHASRNNEEVMNEINNEIQSKNAILESRLICGSESLLKQCYHDLLLHSNPIKQLNILIKGSKMKNIGTFDMEKLVYLQEPDIKNGVGGLRDYQNILWIIKIKLGYKSFKDLAKNKLLRFDEDRNIVKAYDFLLRVRNELHYQNKRATDKLNLEQQEIIATRLKYSQKEPIERLNAFMQDYYSATRSIYSICELLKERLFEIELNRNKRFSFLMP